MSCRVTTCVLLLAFAVVRLDCHELSEAQQMALEISGVMLSPKKLSSMLEEHLAAIRKLYPDMTEISHRPKWVPGELIVTADEAVVDKVNKSRYGPLTKAERLSDADDSGLVTFKLVYPKPYHPERLAERMKSDLGIESAYANAAVGDGNDVKYHASAPTYHTYTFKLGWGSCPSGCIYNHYWEFTVAPSAETLTVKLEKEYGSDLSLELNV